MSVIDMSELASKQVTVVGMGLMGASLAGALRHKCRSVVGVARRAESVKIALARDTSRSASSPFA